MSDINTPDGSRAVPALVAQLEALQRLLERHEALWRVSPFHELRPGWVEARPDLAQALLSLPGAAVDQMSESAEALTRWMTPWIPDLGAVSSWWAVTPTDRPSPGPERFFAHVPGTKRAQVEAFADAVTAAGAEAPWLEWCAGKGHLGRWLAHRTGRPVLSLEWDPVLCAAGAKLAARTDSPQRFECVDVHAANPATLSGRHVVALHACGDLHRRLLACVDVARVPAVDLAPCCYDRTQEQVYAGLNPEADLRLDRVALKLAVTDVRCLSARGQAQRRRTLGWKLAYKLARQERIGVDLCVPLASTPRSWARLSFADWCRALAARDGWVIDDVQIDFRALERAGHALRERFERLNLVRLTFRRALEMWLVVDIGLYLARRGYRVSFGAFCSDALTPRNLIVSARAG